MRYWLGKKNYDRSNRSNRLNGAQRLNGLNVLNFRPDGAKGVNEVDHPL
jgi:hypothetical protein